MSNTATVPATTRAAYQRPYKSRRERRIIDRDKHKEGEDYTFLKRVGTGVALLLLLAITFAVIGFIDRENAMPPRPRSHFGM